MIWLHLPNGKADAVKTMGGNPGSVAIPGERRGAETPADLVHLAIHIAPECAVVALSNHVSQEEGLVCLEAGASGYTSALSNPTVLQQIAMVVENGGFWLGPDLMTRLRTSLARLMPHQVQEVQNKLASLSPREREVALAVAAGASNKEVARDMGITERTVKAHLSAIFENLGLRDRMQLIILLNGSHA
jgi:DNA-binding NarL/FixJ family response regulator